MSHQFFNSYKCNMNLSTADNTVFCLFISQKKPFQYCCKILCFQRTCTCEAKTLPVILCGFFQLNVFKTTAYFQPGELTAVCQKAGAAYKGYYCAKALVAAATGRVPCTSQVQAAHQNLSVPLMRNLQLTHLLHPEAALWLTTLGTAQDSFANQHFPPGHISSL